ncbi:hypothetical protein, partial [Pantoea dispersa]|uniref:hypothetical protein n=1 Tax=Pantoea dispersa TaxID=59814 RepID=UPI0021C66882
NRVVRSMPKYVLPGNRQDGIYNDAGQVLSSGVFMRICGKVAQYRRVRIHAHRREDENVCFDKRHCAINCAATIRAVISGITWKGYLLYPVAQTVAARFIAQFQLPHYSITTPANNALPTGSAYPASLPAAEALRG